MIFISSLSKFKFLYFDKNNLGTIYLFGRIRAPEISTFESCCIVVKNVIRQLFFLKRNKAIF